MNTDAVDLLIRRELPAAALGDRDAYGRIIQASQNAVTAVALAITRDVPASEDIAQEAFLSAWQHLRRLQNPASFLPWLRQITRNLAHDHLRARRQRPLDGEAAELVIARAADPSTPMQRLIDDERETVAADLISDLPEESREVLLLFYREGRSSRQVAALLGLSDAAVRKRLSRARQSVREDLLRRFADFARETAPGATFALAVTTAIGGFSKPAAAAGAMTAGSSLVAGIAAKSALGSMAAAGGGLFVGVLVAWLCRGLLARYADDEVERRAILRTYNGSILTSVLIVIGVIAAAWLFDSRLLALVVLAAGMAVINYQMLVSLPRVMDPLLARDATRHPQGAARRQMFYRLTFGVSGTLISNIAVLGMLAIAYLRVA